MKYKENFITSIKESDPNFNLLNKKKNLKRSKLNMIDFLQLKQAIL